MWEIYEHRRVVRRLSKTPSEVLKRYEKWKDVVRHSGPVGLKTIRGFRDEALRGGWKGFRSSRLDNQYRVIYRVTGQELSVWVVELTPHDYRKR